MNTVCGRVNKQRSGALHLTQKVDYGLILLIFLAKNEGKKQLSVKKISEDSKVSFLFLQKIAGYLQKAGLIKAARGKLGGYSLNKASNKINLGEIIEALEGPVALVPCIKTPFKNVCKHIGHCTVRPSLIKINKEILTSINSKTLDYFVS